MRRNAIARFRLKVTDPADKALLSFFLHTPEELATTAAAVLRRRPTADVRVFTEDEDREAARVALAPVLERRVR